MVILFEMYEDENTNLSLIVAHGYRLRKNGLMRSDTIAICRELMRIIRFQRSRGYRIRVLLVTDLAVVNGDQIMSVSHAMEDYIRWEFPDVYIEHSKTGCTVDTITEVAEVIGFLTEERVNHFSVLCIWGHHFRLKYLYEARGLHPAVIYAKCFRPWKILLHLLWTIPNMIDPFGVRWWSRWIQGRRCGEAYENLRVKRFDRFRA